MTPAELLDEAAAAGLSLVLDTDGGLIVRPRSRCTPEIVERLRAAKPALIAYLSRRDRLLRHAADELRQHPDRRRAVVFDPDDAQGTTYTAGVAVRLSDGGIAAAVMTGIRTADPFLLVEAAQRACEVTQ